MAIKSQEPLSGETLLLDNSGSEDVADRVVKSSREYYAKKYVAPEPKEEPKKEAAPTTKSDTRKTKPKMQGKDRLKQRRKRSANKGQITNSDNDSQSK